MQLLVMARSMNSPNGVGVIGPMGLGPESHRLASGDGSSRRGLNAPKFLAKILSKFSIGLTFIMSPVPSSVRGGVGLCVCGGDESAVKKLDAKEVKAERLVTIFPELWRR